jgi:WD40 repeat protein
VLNEPSAEPASELQALAYKALENLDETRVLNLKTSAHAVAYDGPQGLLVAVPGLLLAWNPDTNTLAKVAAFGTDGKSTGETPVDLAVSPDNTRALVGMFSQNLYLVDIAGRKAMRLADTPSGNNGVFSPDGEHLVTWGWSGAPARMWRRAGSSFTEVPQYFSDLAADVRTAAYTRDATRIALGSLKGVVYVLDVKSVGHPGDLRQSLQPDGKVDGLISSIAFHPRDSDLLLVIKAQHPYLCRLTTGACAQAHEGSAIRGSFSPDGQYAAVVTNDGTLYVYRMLHGRDVLDRPEHTFKFGRSGRSMAWNPASPQELAVAALASDERQLPPDANTKGSVWVWNVTSALSRNIKESAPLTATAMTHPIHLSHPAVEIFRDPRGGAVRVAARRSGISSGDLVLDGRTSEPLAAGLSPTAEWLAWSLPDGGILLFHLTKSLAPMALLGESTKWERLQFAANNVLVAQDHSGTRHVWREFDGSDNLASFARDSLPLQSDIDDLSSIPENPTKLEPPTRLLPSDAECRNLLGKWITPAHDADEGRAPAALKPPRRDGAICG